MSSWLFTICHPILQSSWSVPNTIFYQHKKVTRQTDWHMKKSSSLVDWILYSAILSLTHSCPASRLHNSAITSSVHLSRWIQDVSAWLFLLTPWHAVQTVLENCWCWLGFMSLLASDPNLTMSSLWPNMQYTPLGSCLNRGYSSLQWLRADSF